MATVTFDTLKFVKTLESAGIDREQASAFAAAVRDAHDAADVATKADLRELEHCVETRFAKMDGELKLHRAMLGMILGGIAALVLTTFF